MVGHLQKNPGSPHNSDGLYIKRKSCLKNWIREATLLSNKPARPERGWNSIGFVRFIGLSERSRGVLQPRSFTANGDQSRIPHFQSALRYFTALLYVDPVYSKVHRFLTGNKNGGLFSGSSTVQKSTKCKNFGEFLFWTPIFIGFFC